MDLLVASLGSDPAYKTYHDGFYRGSGLDHLLNTVEANKRGYKRLREWMRHRAISMVLDIVDNEMDELKDEFRMSVEQVTPAFLLNFDLKKQVVSVLNEKSPVLRSILLRASRSNRGISQNDIKDAETVRFHFCISVQVV